MYVAIVSYLPEKWNYVYYDDNTANLKQPQSIFGAFNLLFVDILLHVALYCYQV